MGTAARKARKRAGEKLVKEQKVGTPVELRVENQPRSIFGRGPWRPSRFGLTSKAAARLRAVGIERSFEGPVEGSK